MPRDFPTSTQTLKLLLQADGKFSLCDLRGKVPVPGYMIIFCKSPMTAHSPAQGPLPIPRRSAPTHNNTALCPEQNIIATPGLQRNECVTPPSAGSIHISPPGPVYARNTDMAHAATHSCCAAGQKRSRLTVPSAGGISDCEVAVTEASWASVGSRKHRYEQKIQWGSERARLC